MTSKLFSYRSRSNRSSLGLTVLIFLSLMPWIFTAASLAASVPIASSAPNSYTAFLGLLSQHLPAGPTLSATVRGLVENSRSSVGKGLPVSMMVVAYRENDDAFEDLVVQTFHDSSQDPHGALNPGGVVRTRLGPDLFGPADKVMDLLYHQVDHFGAANTVGRHQRAFEASLNGDLTFLREITVDPLRLIALLPDASGYLPRSLKDRVNSIVIDVTLTFRDWHSEISFITEDGETAEDVAFVVAAWREMAVHLVDIFAAYRTGRDLRMAVHGSDLRVDKQRVIASTTLPTRTAVRVSHELVGYGPPSRVTICHLGQTLTVSEHVLPNHLAHGDVLGACEDRTELENGNPSVASR